MECVFGNQVCSITCIFVEFDQLKRHKLIKTASSFYQNGTASDSLLSQFYKRGKFLTFKYFMHNI